MKQSNITSHFTFSPLPISDADVPEMNTVQSSQDHVVRSENVENEQEEVHKDNKVVADDTLTMDIEENVQKAIEGGTVSSLTSSERRDLFLAVAGTKAMLQAYGGNARCFNATTMHQLELVVQLFVHDMVKKAADCASGRNSAHISKQDIYMAHEAFRMNNNAAGFMGMRDF